MRSSRLSTVGRLASVRAAASSSRSVRHFAPPPAFRNSPSGISTVSKPAVGAGASLSLGAGLVQENGVAEVHRVAGKLERVRFAHRDALFGRHPRLDQPIRVRVERPRVIKQRPDSSGQKQVSR